MATVYANALNDDFNRHDGAMVGYYAADRTSTITPRHHYDLRAFHTTDQTLTFTQTDSDFWHPYAYGSLNVGNARSLGTLAGTETWDTSSGSVTVGKDATFRYANTLKITTGSATTVDATYGNTTYGTVAYGSTTFSVAGTFAPDDILTDFSDPARTYYLELTLRNFPAQAAATHFDLSNSFIDITSSNTFAANATDSLTFSSSLNDVSAGGDTYLRFPRTLLSKADLRNIVGVRFRMRSLGGTSTLIAQSLRLVDDVYTWQLIDTDTKRQQLTRSVPRAGGAESSSVYGDVYFKDVRPKNTTYITLFNSGHNPSGNDNTFRQFFRTKTNGDRIEIKLTARDTQSRLSILQTLSGATTTLTATAINTNILLPETYYYLVTELIGTQVRASIYQRSGISLGSLVYTTGFTTTGVIGQGLVGYSFEPYNYDFTIQSVAPQSTEFAVFQSTAFNSRKLVRGATLYPINSSPINIIDSMIPTAWGDGALVTDANGDLVITRTGTLTQGGVKYTPLTYMGNSSQLILTGSLWTTLVQGTYRAALVNGVDEVEWIGVMSNILPNQWNQFTLSVSPGLLPDMNYLYIQQTDAYSGSFKLRDIQLGAKTIAWNISPDNGTTWQPFLDALGDQFTGAMFATPTTQMKLQAVANTDQGWISGYQLEPHYVY